MNMLNERIAEMIQADVDGVLADSDRDELNEAVETSIETRAFRDEMLQVANILNTMPELDPPVDLTRRILDSIELPSKRQLPSWLRNWFQPVSYGLAVAAGMLITIGMVKILPISDLEMTSLVGSMVQQGDVLPKTTRSQLGVDLEAVTGSILLKELNGALALQFDLVSAEPVEIGIKLSESGLKFGGLAHETKGVNVFEVSGGNVRVMNQGTQQFVIFLRQPNGSANRVKDLAVTISQDELRIFKGSIAFGG